MGLDDERLFSDSDSEDYLDDEAYFRVGLYYFI